MKTCALVLVSLALSAASALFPSGVQAQDVWEVSEAFDEETSAGLEARIDGGEGRLFLRCDRRGALILGVARPGLIVDAGTVLLSVDDEEPLALSTPATPWTNEGEPNGWSVALGVADPVALLLEKMQRGFEVEIAVLAPEGLRTRRSTWSLRGSRVALSLIENACP